MAAININWSEVVEQVGDKAASSHNVEKYESDLRQIMSSGAEFEVSKLKAILEAGYNANKEEGEEKVEVHWSTVKYTLTHKSGFKAVPGKVNTFVADDSVVRAKKARGKKIQQ